MTTTVDAGLDLRLCEAESRGRVAAMLSATAHAGPAALFTVAAKILTQDFLHVDEVDGLSDVNLAMVGLAIQEGAPELIDGWRTILYALDAS